MTSAPDLSGKGERSSHSAWPPLAYWLIPFGVALLGCLPKLWLHFVPPPEGTAYLGVTYLPMDFLAYEAFIRQAATDGGFLMSNPFTTEPHAPRFILLFHWMLGRFSAVTHLSPGTVLEISRIALVFVFFGVLWWFLRPILRDDRDRRWAALLIGFAGGFESWLRELAPSISDRTEAGNRFAQDTWTAYGWNFLASSFNPLWLAGIVVALISLRYFLAENALSTVRDRLAAGTAVFLLYWIHPYTAIGTVAIIGLHPCVAWFARGRLEGRAVVRVILTLSVPLAAIATIVLWQMRDPVYRASSGGFWGGRDASIFWYPLTLGALGWMAVLGAREWFRERHPFSVAMTAWVIAIVFLHTSPLFNGYHFVFLLPIPLCIVAASSVRKVIESSPSWQKIVLTMALFGAPIFILLGALKAAEANVTSVDTMRLVATLSTLPDGNALVPPPMGNIIPARSGHHVWAGHWFLTPEYALRDAEYKALLDHPGQAPGLTSILQQNRIRYLVIPSDRLDPIRRHLGAYVLDAVPQGQWTLLTLHGSRGE